MSEAKSKERDIKCKVCGDEFHHTITGKGRPPEKCEKCRTVKAKTGAPKRRGRPPKKDKVVTVTAGESVGYFLAPVDGPIEAGDTVVMPLDMFKNRDHAIQFATPYTVIAVTDTEALLDFGKNGAITDLSKLVKVARQTA